MMLSVYAGQTKKHQRRATRPVNLVARLAAVFAAEWTGSAQIRKSQTTVGVANFDITRQDLGLVVTTCA